MTLTAVSNAEPDDNNGVAIGRSQGGIMALGSTNFNGTDCRRPAPLVLNGGSGIVVGCRLARGHDEPCQVIVLWR